MTTHKSRTRYLQTYVIWAKSILAENGTETCTQSDLRDPLKIARLLDILWPKAELAKKLSLPEVASQTTEERMRAVLEFFHTSGIVHSIVAVDVLDITKPALAELMWLIILNYCVHSPTLNPFLRNAKVGERMVLNWCRIVLPNLYIDHNESLVQNICQECALIDVIERFCKVPHHQDTATRLKNCLQCAQTELAVPADLIDPAKVVEKTVDGEVLLIYLSLFRRKVQRKQGLSRALSMGPSRRAIMPPPVSRQSSNP